MSTSASTEQARVSPVSRHRRGYRWIAVAAGVLIVLMTYFPIIFVVSNSLKTGNNIFTNGVFSLFTQFDYENYVQAWSGVSAQLLNTIIVAALSIVLGVTAAALGAYAFSQLTFRGKSLLFLAYIGLLMIPWTLTLIPLFLTIQKLHLFNTWWALILPYAATAQPLLVLIFRSFFDQIPRELVESARIDGCTEPQVLRRVVVPLTRPVLLTGAILVTINVWGDYLWVTIVIQDPHKVTISAGVQQFVSSFGLNVSSGGSVFAAFVIATVPMFVLVGFTMRYFVSGLTQGATKL
jgi:ABC-type glycerol-3-phosphate transport system permease component